MSGAGGAGATSGAGGAAGSSAGMAGSGGTADTSECRVWLATNGNDNNPGTDASPVLTLPKAYDLICPPPPGTAPIGAECLGPSPRGICVKPGNYAMSEHFEFRKTRMGTANNRLILRGDPRSSARPVFNFSTQPRLACAENQTNQGGFSVNADYVTIKNLTVRGANDSCIFAQGAEGLIEYVLTYECADTGIQIASGNQTPGSGTNNTIRNCDSHSNFDVQCDGENADGFGIKEGTGAGNQFVGCRAWNNADDGFDLFAWTSAVRIENSWAFDQCASTQGMNSGCNGFVLGGDAVPAAHQLESLIAVGNSRRSGNGFTENSNPSSLTCSATCASWGNIVDVDSVAGVSTTPFANANVTNMAADSARNADGSLKAITSL
jgi:hypothetical protein